MADRFEVGSIPFRRRFLCEVRAGSTHAVKTRTIDFDAKRFVLYQEIIDDRDGTLAATAEHMQLDVRLASRPLVPKVLETLRKARRYQGESILRNVSRATDPEPAHRRDEANTFFSIPSLGRSQRY
ncbi:thioesterase family protein [Bradyrhizobium sp. CCBAU 45384]|uniref:thioesterase family protein n=1 Tax=Bradyrhizobium sp. CCBAU 45384 TaxID=858428 RepID=UPI003FA41A03